MSTIASNKHIEKTPNNSLRIDNQNTKKRTDQISHLLFSQIRKKVIEIACIVLFPLKIVAFPLRFIGSKTWSIPGIVIRTPIILFKRLIFKEPITKTSFFGSGYDFNNGKQLSKKGTKEIMRYAGISVVPFRYEFEKWSEPYGAKIVSPSELNLDLTKVPGKMEADKHAFIDRECFFKTLVLEDEHELIVTFSPLHSHWHDYSDCKIAKNKFNKQLLSVFSVYLGGMPRAYQQADALMEQLKVIAQTKNKKIVVVGQSWSGAVASYVSLNHEVKGICFNSVQLGVGLQRKLGHKKLANAEQHLTQISIDRDFLSQRTQFSLADRFFSAVGVRTPGNFGKRFTVPSAFKSMRESHDYPLKSLMAYIGYDKETKASELKKKDIIKSS